MNALRTLQCREVTQSGNMENDVRADDAAGAERPPHEVRAPPTQTESIASDPTPLSTAVLAAVTAKRAGGSRNRPTAKNGAASRRRVRKRQSAQTDIHKTVLTARVLNTRHSRDVSSSPAVDFRTSAHRRQRRTLEMLQPRYVRAFAICVFAMDLAVKTTVKAVSSTLYRLLLHPSNAKLDGELYYEDDAQRFREKGLDIQDFAPTYIDVYHYARRPEEKSQDSVLNDLALETEVQVFSYSFSYVPDPTWLVNWENGDAADEWNEAGMVQLDDRPENLELGLGEYVTGGVIEFVKKEPNDPQLRILSLATNKGTDLTISQCSEGRKQYRLRLPEGYGILGRFPAPRSSFGFYVGWMRPKQWTIRRHFWFPDSFRQSVRATLLTLHVFARERTQGTGPSTVLPPSVLHCIFRWLCTVETINPGEEIQNTDWPFIEEVIIS